MGLTEDELCIGDSFQIGEAVVQVSQPRQPCFKLSLIHERKDMPLLIQNTGYTGYYFRVLKEGMVCPVRPISAYFKAGFGHIRDRSKPAHAS